MLAAIQPSDLDQCETLARPSALSAKRTATRCEEGCWQTPYRIRVVGSGLWFSVTIRARDPWPAASAHPNGQVPLPDLVTLLHPGFPNPSTQAPRIW